MPDARLRQAWRNALDGRGPRPDEPAAIEPLRFEGVDEAGAVVQIRGAKDELQVWLDGALAERISGKKFLVNGEPAARFRLGRRGFEETFNASPEALDALAAFLADEGSEPPWDAASELLADG